MEMISFTVGQGTSLHESLKENRGVDKKRTACERNGSAFEAGRKTDPARRHATRSFSGLVYMRYKSIPRLCANVCDKLYMFWGPK